MTDIVCGRCGQHFIDTIAAKEHHCEGSPLSGADKQGGWDKDCHCEECENKRQAADLAQRELTMQINQKHNASKNSKQPESLEGDYGADVSP